MVTLNRLAKSQISVIFLLNLQVSLFTFFVPDAVCLDQSNLVTVVLALFSNFSVTFVSGVQIFSHHMHAVFNSFPPFTYYPVCFIGSGLPAEEQCHPSYHLTQITQANTPLHPLT